MDSAHLQTPESHGSSLAAMSRGLVHRQAGM
jgi:hypothetical protein